MKSEIIAKLQSLHDPQKVTVIAVDGLTAAGKTILAKSIQDELQKKGLETWIYGLDWTLAPRSDRLKDLENLKDVQASFAFEAELHMRLDIVEQFLEKVAEFNQVQKETKNANVQSIHLEGLYSREHDGTLEGTASVALKPGLILLLEGHYTLRSELDHYIDYNIVLLGDLDELLKRKVDRVQGYRGADQATDYFWRIDVPSFVNHLKRFGWNADLIVDNTDYTSPVVKSVSYLKEWIGLRNRPECEGFQTTGPEQTPSWLLSVSKLVPQDLRQQIDDVIQLILQWDASVGSYLRTSIDQIQVDLEGLARQAVKEANARSRSKEFQFKVMHTDALYNVYHRKLPITLGLSIVDDAGHFQVGVLSQVNNDRLLLQLFWRGGYKKLVVERKLGEISKDQTLAITEPKEFFSVEQPIANRLDVYAPTSFTIPAFLKGVEYHPIFIGREGENISASETIQRLLKKGGVWIHRFALFSEIRFFQFIMECSGAICLPVGNYLITFFSSQLGLRRKFKQFASTWYVPLNRRLLFEDAQDQIDSFTKDDMKQAWHFVHENCPNFLFKDGHLFSQFMYGNEQKIESGLNELKKMLGSNNRILRKRSTQFILNYFPNFSIPTRALWTDLPVNSLETISLSALNALSPTIMAEVYLWMALRDEPSSILGATIYDLSNKAIDTEAHLVAATENNIPIVLQMSLNAVGQEEDGKIGYLRPNQGVEDFARICKNKIRDLVLQEKIEQPFFGLGLDHVNFDNDIPEGRAKRFLERGLATGMITHAVLDGSALFNAKTKSEIDLREAYTRIAQYAVSLVENPRSCYLTDFEICIGELSYVGNTAMIPTEEELHLFVQAYQAAIEKAKKTALLARPKLFVGNLGTTHHGRDTIKPQTELSVLWKEHLKCESFISPVLHGTTKSHRGVLEKASHGCHKINIAGDFLSTFVRNLPEQLNRKLEESNGDIKRSLHTIRDELNSIDRSELDDIYLALKSHTQNVCKSIASPSLTAMDMSFFKYMTYEYSKKHINVIVEEIRERLERLKNRKNISISHPECDYEFAASMIEVTPEDIKGPLCETLWANGIRYFHIDAGDGKFISRKFSGLTKARYLRRKFPEARLHAHLMAIDPHHSVDGELPLIQQYAEAGCDAIAIHPRSLSKKEEIFSALKYIAAYDCRPGIIIETHDPIDSWIKDLIETANLDWSVVMGVPVGYGGQIFQFSTLSKIAGLAEYFQTTKRQFLIECDGGLNFDNIQLCRDAGAQIFAGWSIVKSSDLSKLETNVNRVYSLIRS